MFSSKDSRNSCSAETICSSENADKQVNCMIIQGLSSKINNSMKQTQQLKKTEVQFSK